jgi:hypothetical protein
VKRVLGLIAGRNVLCFSPLAKATEQHHTKLFMTIKEAILRSLGEIINPATPQELYQYITERGYYVFEKGKTPVHTISAQVGSFIRTGDSRVKRVKLSGGTYAYYLTSLEESIDFADYNTTESETAVAPKTKRKLGYEERDLHLLLSTYLHSTGVHSKTIFHEQSNGKDSNQIWTHPDMVGLKMLKLQSAASNSLMRTVQPMATFKINSYELKREINSDSELKKAYFQAVSNSSWANFGYLVALEISDSLQEEMARLNQSFGIGILLLQANPFETKVLYPARQRDLDFKTMDKLCKINPEFNSFIELSETLLSATDKFQSASQEQFKAFCDAYFTTDEEVEGYCKERGIGSN